MVSGIPPVGIAQNERFLSCDTVLLGVRFNESFRICDYLCVQNSEEVTC
jgi:hypothetical protein